jgi:hypothetical protein
MGGYINLLIILILLLFKFQDNYNEFIVVSSIDCLVNRFKLFKFLLNEAKNDFFKPIKLLHLYDNQKFAMEKNFLMKHTLIFFK